MSAMMTCAPTWATRVRAYLMGKDGLRQRTGTKANHTPLGDSSFPPSVLHSLSNKPLPVSYIHVTCHLTAYFLVFV